MESKSQMFQLTSGDVAKLKVSGFNLARRKYLNLEFGMPNYEK